MLLNEGSRGQQITTPEDSLFADLPMEPGDPLLGLIGLYAADRREEKIDLGVGVYRNEDGATPVFAAVKAAEEYLSQNQSSKSYLGPEGDTNYFKAVAALIFGDFDVGSRLVGVQTPGGTGALRLGAELVAKALPNATVHLGVPTWPNHAPLFQSAKLSLGQYRHMHISTQSACFDEAIATLCEASAGDVVVLHGCCHNPTGVDFSLEQWERLALLMAEHQLLPFIDFAYHGLGDGLDYDRAGLCLVATHCPEMLIAYSCDKNFGLYRERVGALLSLTSTTRDAALVQSNLLSLARANWSMPPDHGAATVRVIMESKELTSQWRTELTKMRERIAAMRSSLAELYPAFDFIARQKGMFSTLPLNAEQILALREDHGVYMAGSGRINIAGLVPTNLTSFAAALAAVR